MIGPNYDLHLIPPSLQKQGYYTYENFVTAAKTYPIFASHPDPTIAKREIAAFLANLFQETRFSFNIEIACSNGKVCNQYGNQPWSMPVAVPNCTRPEAECRYQGRGPIQLSYWKNYLDASTAIYGDDRLVHQPWRVSEEGSVGWSSAMWYWTMRGAHTEIERGNFGGTIKSINGAQECGANWSDKPETRVKMYLTYCAQLGVDPGTQLKC
jgi:hypothetical protein